MPAVGQDMQVITVAEGHFTPIRLKEGEPLKSMAL